jgi:hypothetical protein
VVTTDFGGVAVDDADVPVALVALDVDLLGVHTQDLVLGHVEFEVNDVQKPDDVAKQLLGDALARAVDGELEVGARKHHGRGEHGDGNGFAKAPWCADQYLLWRRVPRVELKEPVVIFCKGAGAVTLKKDASAALEILLMKQALMK